MLDAKNFKLVVPPPPIDTKICDFSTESGVLWGRPILSPGGSNMYSKVFFGIERIVRLYLKARDISWLGELLVVG